jgi:hypothetical protein
VLPVGDTEDALDLAPCSLRRVGVNAQALRLAGAEDYGVQGERDVAGVRLVGQLACLDGDRHVVGQGGVPFAQGCCDRVAHGT